MAARRPRTQNIGGKGQLKRSARGELKKLGKTVALGRATAARIRIGREEAPGRRRHSLLLFHLFGKTTDTAR